MKTKSVSFLLLALAVFSSGAFAANPSTNVGSGAVVQPDDSKLADIPSELLLDKTWLSRVFVPDGYGLGTIPAVESRLDGAAGRDRALNPTSMILTSPDVGGLQLGTVSPNVVLSTPPIVVSGDDGIDGENSYPSAYQADWYPSISLRFGLGRHHRE